LLATAAGGHRAPATAAAQIQEEPAAVATRAAVQAGEPARAAQQLDGIGGDREAHAAELLGPPVEPVAAVVALDQRAVGHGLGVGEAQSRERELVGLAAAGERAEDVVQRAAQAARELELLGAAGPPGDAHAG